MLLTPFQAVQARPFSATATAYLQAEERYRPVNKSLRLADATMLAKKSSQKIDFGKRQVKQKKNMEVESES